MENGKRRVGDRRVAESLLHALDGGFGQKAAWMEAPRRWTSHRGQSTSRRPARELAPVERAWEKRPRNKISVG
jgi:hypothetical protein